MITDEQEFRTIVYYKQTSATQAYEELFLKAGGFDEANRLLRNELKRLNEEPALKFQWVNRIIDIYKAGRTVKKIANF